MNWIQDHITKDFQLLPGTLSPAEALELVSDKYGVVLDEHSEPVALVTDDDLKQAANQGTSSLLDTKVGFPLTIIVSFQVNMQDLVNWKGLSKQDEKIRGAIVIDDNTVFGILTVEIIGTYLNNRDYQLRGDIGSIGDSGLGGKHQPLKFSIQCACGFYNKLSFLDRKKLPTCQNSNKLAHELKLS
ncbi:hypothetical protein [Nostoc commune]|uniref:hypothetical protein n=1 Tax=Nostoc commune TaxID=1178 RepID=UPI0018C5E39D|nr:hypothetical protein [Nostoc commune]MBG1260609.1 hypothetical protein [Nostoc commune BAE]